MRITKPQAVLLHNEAVHIREQVKAIETYITAFSKEEQTVIKENLKEIYESLNRQQATVSYFLNGFPVKSSLIQEEPPESWVSALVDELEISDASIRLLKRHDIFSIASLKTFLQNQSLSDLKGCGSVKAEQIEEALERYLENKTIKKEGNNNG